MILDSNPSMDLFQYAYLGMLLLYSGGFLAVNTATMQLLNK